MKSLKLLLIILFAVSAATYGQKTENSYDEALAKKLGADAYGMKNYFFVILVSGTYQPKDSVEKSNLFAGHMANITKLAKEGKLVVAGPFGKNDKNYRGLFILDVKSKEEAMQYLMDDPSIKTGLFEVQLIPWYGSAALPEYLPIHDKIQKKSY